MKHARLLCIITIEAVCPFQRIEVSAMQDLARLLGIITSEAFCPFKRVEVVAMQALARLGRWMAGKAAMYQHSRGCLSLQAC